MYPGVSGLASLVGLAVEILGLGLTIRLADPRSDGFLGHISLVKECLELECYVTVYTGTWFIN